jgi:hypothetical protein
MAQYQVVTPTSLGQAALTTTIATIYTVPALSRAFFKQMSVVNTTAGAVTVNIHLVPSGGAASTANAIYFEYSIAAKGTLDWNGMHVLNTGGTIQAKASATGITITASGGEAV